MASSSLRSFGGRSPLEYVWSYRDEGPLGRVDGRGGLRRGEWGGETSMGLDVRSIVKTQTFVGLAGRRTVQTPGLVDPRPP